MSVPKGNNLPEIGVSLCLYVNVYVFVLVRACVRVYKGGLVIVKVSQSVSQSVRQSALT